MNLADTSTHINFYFTSELSFTNIDDSQDSKGRSEDISLSPLYHFHLLHRHLDISWMATGERSPVHIASSRTSTENLSIPIQLTCLWERGRGKLVTGSWRLMILYGDRKSALSIIFFALHLTVFNANLVKIKFNFFRRSYKVIFSPMKNIYSAIHW